MLLLVLLHTADGAYAAMGDVRSAAKVTRSRERSLYFFLFLAAAAWGEMHSIVGQPGKEMQGE